MNPTLTAYYGPASVPGHPSTVISVAPIAAPGYPKTRITTNPGSNCARVLLTTKGMSGVYRNSWIWNTVSLRICCDGQKTVNISASIFPSQSAWQDGVFVDSRSQTTPASVMWQAFTDTVPGKTWLEYTKAATGTCEVSPAPGQPKWIT